MNWPMFLAVLLSACGIFGGVALIVWITLKAEQRFGHATAMGLMLFGSALIMATLVGLTTP